MLFIYIAIRSKLSELLAHIKLINEFSTDTLRHSKLGYYTSTLEVAVQQVMTFDNSQFNYNDGRSFSVQEARSMIE
jgi:hypothetical protein